MMLLAALLLQAAAQPSRAAPRTPAVPAAPAAPRLRAIDSAAAIDAFVATCWPHLLDPDALREAIASGTLPLAPQPRREGVPTEQWRSDQAILSYTASDSLPAGVPPRQCVMTVRLAGAVDQLSLAARIAEALKLPTGRTRTGAGLSQTSWDVARDGRTLRLIAATRNAAGVQSDLRLTALLLAPR